MRRQGHSCATDVIKLVTRSPWSQAALYLGPKGTTLRLFRHNALLCTPKDFAVRRDHQVSVSRSDHPSGLLPDAVDRAIDSRTHRNTLSGAQVDVYLPAPETDADGQFAPWSI